MRTQPLMVPTLAWSEAPSARTKFASTTLRIAGTAPQTVVHQSYCQVAAAVSAVVPRIPSICVWKRAKSRENISEKPAAQ